MNTNTLPSGGRPLRADADAAVDVHEAVHSHSICWGAVLAGAAGAASLSLILLVLGVGLGLSSVSPWSSEGVSAEAFGVSTILWLAFTQLAASGLGGYLAGRLRHRWSHVQADEVHFRDTAHGFLAWSVATLATAGLLTSAIGAIVGGGAKAGVAAAGVAPSASMVAATAASTPGISPEYFVDTLFRRVEASAVAPPAAAASAPAARNSDGGAFAPASPVVAPPGSMPLAVAPATQDAPPTAEVVRIYMNATSANALPVEDARYLGQLVAQRTGLGQQEAEKRVTDAFARLQAKATAAREQAKGAADKARSASAKAALWGFISLLIGAFVASLLGTLGGRHRDQF